MPSARRLMATDRAAGALGRLSPHLVRRAPHTAANDCALLRTVQTARILRLHWSTGRQALHQYRLRISQRVSRDDQRGLLIRGYLSFEPADGPAVDRPKRELSKRPQARWRNPPASVWFGLYRSHCGDAAGDFGSFRPAATRLPSGPTVRGCPLLSPREVHGGSFWRFPARQPWSKKLQSCR